MLIEYKGVMGLATVIDYLIDSEVVHLDAGPAELVEEALLLVPEHLTQNYKISKVFESSLYILSVETEHKMDMPPFDKLCLNLSQPVDPNRRPILPSFEQTKHLLTDCKDPQS